MYRQEVNNLKMDAKENFPDYTGATNIVSRVLTPEMYVKLYGRKTSFGTTVDDCIQPSINKIDCDIGLCAGDEEAYKVFGELFDGVIDLQHRGFKATDKQPAPELDPEKLVGGELDPKYVKSCRVRSGRNIRGFPLSPKVNRAHRRAIQDILVSALGKMDGKYYSLRGMTKAEETELREGHFLFQKPTGHFLVDTGCARDWPDARGIWLNKDKTLLVWINEEDHSRIISMQKDSNMKATFARFCSAIKQVEAGLKASGKEFMHSDRLGVLATCPSNIGTALRCSVHCRIPNLSKHPKFTEIIKGMEMQWRGTGGEDSEAVDSVYDLSNAARLKKTEREFVQHVIDGTNKVIEMEKRLEAGKSIDDLMPASCK